MKLYKTKSTLLVLLSIFSVLLACYCVVPKVYIELKTKDYEASFNTLTTQVINTSNYQKLANTYALENDAIVCITDKTTNMTYSTPSTKVSHSLQKHQTINNLEVDVLYTFDELGTIQNLLFITLPSVGALIFIFYLLIPSEITKKETYDDFYKMTEEMLMFKPKARIDEEQPNIKTKQVAKNINQIYALLLEKKEQYDALGKDYQMLLDKSKASLVQTQQQTHNAVNDILNDVKEMLNNQGKYRNQSVYLMEVKVKLEDLLNNKNQPTNLPSTIHEIFKKLIEPYQMMDSNKMVTFNYQLEKNFKIKVEDLLFHQAMGCLMTFILTQCHEQSQITILQDGYDIAIQYQGACLSEESIKEIERIDINVIDAYRYVKQMGFYIEFTQKQEKDGMQFVFHF